LGTPFFTDSTIFSLRSIEYAFMFLPYPVHHHRNPLSGTNARTSNILGLAESRGAKVRRRARNMFVVP
jgi:hypothetical protein